MSLEMLLEIQTGAPIPRGVTFKVSIEAERRCVPLRLRADLDTAARFRIHRIDAGVEPLDVFPPGGRTFEELEKGAYLRPSPLEPRMDLTIEATNTSDGSAHFIAEMWGVFDVPPTRWRVVGGLAPDRVFEEGEALWHFECVKCGHAARPGLMVMAPGWCVQCIRGLVDTPTSTEGGSS